MKKGFLIQAVILLVVVGASAVILMSFKKKGSVSPTAGVGEGESPAPKKTYGSMVDDLKIRVGESLIKDRKFQFKVEPPSDETIDRIFKTRKRFTDKIV